MRLHVVDGLPILLHQNASAFTVLAAHVRVGSVMDPEHGWGTAHALEHMLFKGTEKRPQMEITRAAERLGGSCNGGTSPYSTMFTVEVRNRHWAEALDILSDMFLHATLPRKEWKKEVQNIRSEFHQMEEIPTVWLQEWAFHDSFGDLLHPTIGTDATLRRLTLEKLTEFQGQWYGRPHVYLTVVGGGVDEQDPEPFRRAFADLPTASGEASPKIAFKPKAGVHEISRRGLSEASLLGIRPARGLSDPEGLLEDLAFFMLGGSASSVLFEEVRESSGLGCYDIHAARQNTPLIDFCMVRGGADPDQTTPLLNLVRDILGKFPEFVTEDRFLIAREQMVTDALRMVESSWGWTSIIEHFYEHGYENPVAAFQAQQQAIEGISYEEFRRFIEAEQTRHPAWNWYLLRPK